MGMSIDEAIHDTEVMKEYLEHRDEPRSEGLGVAIETMRKYQKIKEVVNNWHHDIEAKDFECMAEIADVVEEGNEKE